MLEADVALPVVTEFVDQVRLRTVGEDGTPGASNSQEILGIVHEELTRLIGGANRRLEFARKPPSVILVCGLQGTGKTTTSAKLAKTIKDQSKHVLLTSVDVYRPAAIEQLRTLSDSLGIEFYAPEADAADPAEIAAASIALARRKLLDVVIVDTAGRLHIDDEMMHELARVHGEVAPVETLYVVDAMVGQDAVNSAAAFDDVLPLTGIVVTKLDGDARGGALLSVAKVTGKPVKFLGTGEDVDALEEFHPDRMASRILGMGDLASLAESVKGKADPAKAKRMEGKFFKGQRLNLEDYRDQIAMAEDMGGVEKLASHLPDSSLSGALDFQGLRDKFRRELAIIDSMTLRERRNPAIIRTSRKVRIAKGAGVETHHVSQLLRSFEKMSKMSRKMSRATTKRKLAAMNPDMMPFQ